MSGESHLVREEMMGPWEGPFTIAQKYAYLVQPSVKRLMQVLNVPYLLYWSDPRYSSLLFPRASQATWAKRFSPFASLSALRLSNDENFWYCPECLKHGYQAAACQLDMLERCPVHKCQLYAHCRTCGAPTGPYAAVYDSFSAPLSCVYCCNSYAEDIDVALWSNPSNFYERCQIEYGQIDAWLSQLKSVDDQGAPFVSRRGSGWPEQDNSVGNYISTTVPVDRASRAHIAFELAQRLVPLQTPADLWTSTNALLHRFVHVCEPQCHPAHSTLEQFRPIYKSVRRQIQKQWLRLRRFESRQFSALHPCQESSISFEHSFLVQAFCRWRKEFEDPDWARDRRYPNQKRSTTQVSQKAYEHFLPVQYPQGSFFTRQFAEVFALRLAGRPIAIAAHEALHFFYLMCARFCLHIRDLEALYGMESVRFEAPAFRDQGIPDEDTFFDGLYPEEAEVKVVECGKDGHLESTTSTPPHAQGSRHARKKLANEIAAKQSAVHRLQGPFWYEHDPTWLFLPTNARGESPPGLYVLLQAATAVDGLSRLETFYGYGPGKGRRYSVNWDGAFRSPAEFFEDWLPRSTTPPSRISIVFRWRSRSRFISQIGTLEKLPNSYGF